MNTKCLKIIYTRTYKLVSYSLNPGQIYYRKWTSDTSNSKDIFNIPKERVTKIKGSLKNYKTDSSYGAKTCYLYAVFADGTQQELARATSNGKSVTTNFDVSFDSPKNLSWLLTIVNTAANGSVPQTITTTINTITYQNLQTTGLGTSISIKETECTTYKSGNICYMLKS